MQVPFLVETEFQTRRLQGHAKLRTLGNFLPREKRVFLDQLKENLDLTACQE
jgi:uncharacterized SAM-dependent methyltransferase